MIESDEQLVVRSRGGDKAAFSALVQRYERAAIATAWKVLRCWHDADDVAQDALVVAYAKLNRLWNPQKFGPWLLRITHRRALRALRALRRRRRGGQELSADLPAPDDGPSMSGPSLDLMVLIGRLPVQERVVVSLRYLDGLDVAQVAQVTVRPIGTVTKQLSRAHARLRGWLDGEVNDGR